MPPIPTVSCTVNRSSMVPPLPYGLTRPLPSWTFLKLFQEVVSNYLIHTAAFFVLLALLLPTRLYRNNFVSAAAGVALLTALWVGVVQFNDQIIRQSSLRVLGIWGAAYLLSVLFLYLATLKWKNLRRFLRELAERISVLLYIYLPLSLIGLGAVFVRNLF